MVRVDEVAFLSREVIGSILRTYGAHLDCQYRGPAKNGVVQFNCASDEILHQSTMTKVNDLGVIFRYSRVQSPPLCLLQMKFITSYGDRLVATQYHALCGWHRLELRPMHKASLLHSTNSETGDIGDTAAAAASG